jgi:hypothetical protein
MHKVDAAEWLLSLTTNHERAASIAGDLQQESGGRGSVWFWRSVLRAASSLMWRSFTEAPLRLTGLAIGFSVVGFLYVLLMSAFLLFIRFAFSLEASRRGVPWTTYPLIEATLAFLWASYVSGKWLARKAPQRELAVYATSFVIVRLLLFAILLLSPSGTGTRVGDGDVMMDVMLTAGGTLCAFAGIKRARNKLRSASVTSAE